ncbi:CMRF35-like molecule 5 [Pygocentrus nattereri]|uniref:Ig-like domain-containing protein n=1 Tax=Pygocentrus nattereri TaxID=42514 RepID=A0AAR2JC80_PYGNA|nr:CMRF35-like molecule 5 [Pygocentrus nattereri]
MSSLILFVLLLCISDSESMETLNNLAIKRGGSLSIPCFYDEKYKSKRKYWCKGKYGSSCNIVAFTNTSGRTSVTDHPTQNMFTVELNSLQDSDSGYYWCAVEIDGPDDMDYLHLTVNADPAVSVINSRVSGQEGGSVNVQCLYRTEHKSKQKKWCRFKDGSCFTAERTDTSQNSAVLVIDYGNGSINVVMRGLQKSDAGWYWFSAGNVEVPVHLTVTERPSTTTAATTVSASISSTAVSGNEGTNHSGNTLLVWVLLAVGLGLLLTLLSIITWMLRTKSKQAETRGRMDNIAVNTFSTTEDSEVTYSNVNKKKKEPSSAPANENDVIYCNLTMNAENKMLSPAVKAEGVIYSSVVHK